MKIINIFIVNMSIVCLSVMAIDVYVENYYGAIAFQVNKGQTQWIPQNAGPQKLVSINQINSLVIGTRVWSYDLLDLLKRIKEESKKAENNGKDVYLIVKSSGYLDKWNIDPVWRVQVTGFSMKSEAEQEQKRIAEEQKKILEKQIEEKSFERKLQRGTISAQKYLDLIENGLYKQDAGIKDYDTILEKLRTRDYEGAKKKYYADLSIYSKLSGFGYPIINIVVGGIQSNYKEYLDKPQAAYTQIYNKSPMEVRNFVKKLIEEQYTLYLQYQKNGWIQ